MPRVDLRGRLGPKQYAPEPEKPTRVDDGRAPMRGHPRWMNGIRDEWQVQEMDFSALEARVAQRLVRDLEALVLGGEVATGNARLYNAGPEILNESRYLRVDYVPQIVTPPPHPAGDRSARRAARERNHAHDYWNHARRGGRGRY